MKNNKINMTELVKLTRYQLEKLMLGELSFIEHPEKGTCEVDANSVFVKVNNIDYNPIETSRKNLEELLKNLTDDDKSETAEMLRKHLELNRIDEEYFKKRIEYYGNKIKNGSK